MQLSVDTYASFRSYVDVRKVITFGVASTKRAANIPTLREQGTDVALKAWEGFFAPKGTPEDVTRVLETAIENILKEKVLVDQLEKNFVNADFMGRVEFGKFVAKEDARIKGLMQEFGLVKASQ